MKPYWILLVPAAVLAQPVPLDIPAGEATTTVTQLARALGVQVLFDFKRVEHHTTQHLVGTFDTADAFARILDGTGLRFDYINPRTIAVIAPRPFPLHFEGEVVDGVITQWWESSYAWCTPERYTLTLGRFDYTQIRTGPQAFCVRTEP